MASRISRNVVAKFQGNDGDNAEEMWDNMVKMLPQGLRKSFDHPKEILNKRGIDQGFEKEMKLDGNDVSLFIQVSYSVEEDADEDGKYRTESKNVYYWFNVDPWTEDGDEMRNFERDLNMWLAKVKEKHPDLSEKYGLR
jgi:hypothetical protein